LIDFNITSSFQRHNYKTYHIETKYFKGAGTHVWRAKIY